MRLQFLLPADVSFALAPGRHHPCIAGTILTVDSHGNVEVCAMHREQAFDMAARFLGEAVAQDRVPFSMAAVMFADDMPFGRFTWSITIGAKIAFAATSLPPEIYPRRHAAPVRLPRLHPLRARRASNQGCAHER